MTGDLEIVSVSFGNGPLLQQNRNLLEATNQSREIVWTVVENTPVDGPDRLDDDRFRILSGIATPETEYAQASYHHGLALNRGIEQVASRFLLILDPDFYIVQPNWVELVINWMGKNGLAFFGAPWHPRWFLKNRYFPCAHCMFIDLLQVDQANLDFSPDCMTRPAYARHLPNWMRAMDRWRLLDRCFVGRSRDVSWRIADRFSGCDVECLVPLVPTGHLKPAEDQLDRLLPDRFALLPKRVATYTTDDFRRVSLPNHWESFSWQGREFGFHMRNFPDRQAGEVPHRKVNILKQVVERHIDRL